MKRFLILVILLAVANMPQLVQAQWAISPQIVVSVPRNDFANVDQTGGGFSLKAVRTFGDGGFGLRSDFAFITFGKKRTALFDPFTAQLIPIEARNEGFRLTAGPEYRFGGRNLKFYAGSNGGIYFFRTNITSQFQDLSGQYRSISDSEGNNFALGWNLNAGLQYDIGLGPWLDLSFEYQTIYNLPESLADDADTEVEVKDITANEYTIKFGVIFFLK